MLGNRSASFFCSMAEPSRPYFSHSESRRRNLEETISHAHRLMHELGIQELGRGLEEFGWSFSLDHARRRLGSCKWRDRGRRKLITVSRHYAGILGVAHRDARGLVVIDDVIRHEIAHAIDFETRGRSDHSSVWKAICRRVKADPTRLYETSALESIDLPGKYVAACPNCRAQITYYRAPSRPRACRSCCDAFASGRYDARFRLQVTRRY